jgi:hypothetical protein
MSYFHWLGAEAQPYADAHDSWEEYCRSMDALLDWMFGLIDRA